MQLNSINRAVQSSGTMEVAKATIKATPKIFDMFADQTYANKPVAICRELVANGIDAHIAAGTPDVPVEVVMPTELEPEFKVRDHGIGMSHEFVMGPFMAYTDGSTKDQSNDQIGGFGIGSKSPFAYCDQFTLRVVHEGILSVYTMFKDEDGIPSVGLQGQKTTDEHNGVEVSFPVELDDMEDFRSAAQTALQYFFPLPTVTNGTLSPPDYSHVSSTGKWAMRPQQGALGVIMGGVRYPVTTESLPYSVRRDEKVAPLLEYGLDLTMPIGACDVAMSREALSYTDKTSASITKALGEIVDEVAATFATLFDHLPSKWDAQAALVKELTNLSGGKSWSYGSGRVAMMRNFAKYKGQPLSPKIDLSVTRTWDSNQRTYVETLPAGYVRGSAWLVHKPHYRKTFANPKFQQFGSEITELTAGTYEVLFLDDMPIEGKSRTRARVEEYLAKVNANLNNYSLVLRAPQNTDAASIAKLLKFLGSPTNVIRLSTLPEPARQVRTVLATDGSTYVRPKVRMFRHNGLTDTYGNFVDTLTPGHAKRNVVTEIPYADQPTEGILVVLNGWRLPNGLKKKMQTGVIKWDELLFVLKGDAAKLKGSKFSDFDKEYVKRFNKEKRKYPDLPAQLAVEQSRVLDTVLSIAEALHPYVSELPDDKKNTPFGKIFEVYRKYSIPLTSELQAFAAAAEIEPKMPDDVNPDELVANYEKEHTYAQTVIKLMKWGVNFNKSSADLFVHVL